MSNCEKCEQTIGNCITCSSDRINPPICECI